MCQNENDKFRMTYEEFRKQHCDNISIFDISYGNRFGENVIAVYCLTHEEKEQIEKQLPGFYQGFRIYLASPIWGVGDLLIEYRKKIDDYVEAHPNARIYGTPESKVLDSIYKETVQSERVYWKKLSKDERRVWISNYIKKQREHNPHFANCGDKFLVQ